ncbi:protein TolQ [Gammaproteobacteria bacterium]|jgi:biopolymer transport protein TolQ|nr:protein TolQ [Gammaproteobacteria bacterium]MDA8925463.1 protein TolQ [Gammaproteobacteria bacterium]MDA9153973.1 protein TolQ [Gammaproteobacteria bacterium]MDA9340871.1 protein TolQ [Gammaproteobacteria bacterium]MDA9371400.1 protein TolQ [Gammaproteobacteria bacterium]|tara:strand:+ start:4882 stop:5562 length:681 start_codon:yes stop_codon:yes gene_type:complete
MENFSIIDLFLQASLIVQLVMVVLLVISVLSWIVIFERYFNLNKIKSANRSFEDEFWSGKDLNELYESIQDIPRDQLTGSKNVFKHGFSEFLRLADGQNITTEDLESVNRSIRVSLAREEEALMTHLPFLANVGSVSPYVGLFGTVWGIINSFQGLSDATQATINAVAPGISEALVATALGLFAAIPAVVAYNRFASDSDSQLQQSSIFGEELASILYRQTVKERN